ncbi:hypothetical protein L211DRAFT_842626 [Terfezia boudieri ATCC MYA-4762]|uniref:Uncharacterized protein n=1 Tax=Terfezia boudieri ATCC MYA-4762 TaxID=1051890 RepID=A0A3N4LFS7_9PEZI|nr:hypothetical protein L211DRAFT_842626 [Terfezia boudieri ATCC MYA-4762]
MGSPVQDGRVEDFLNDKFQTLADLDTLDELLSSVQNQQSLLRSQACIVNPTKSRTPY